MEPKNINGLVNELKSNPIVEGILLRTETIPYRTWYSIKIVKNESKSYIESITGIDYHTKSSELGNKIDLLCDKKIDNTLNRKKVGKIDKEITDLYLEYDKAKKEENDGLNEVLDKCNYDLNKKIELLNSFGLKCEITNQHTFSGKGEEKTMEVLFGNNTISINYELLFDRNNKIRVITYDEEFKKIV